MRWKTMLFMSLMLALCSCAWLAPAKEDTTALLMATQKLDEAKVKTFALQDETLKTFRDELLARALGEIEQARLDEMHKLSAPTKKVTKAEDGTETITWEPHVFTLAELEAINKIARDMTTAAIKHVNDGYEVGANLQAQKDFNDVYATLRMYWLSRLSEDQQKQAVIESVSKLFTTSPTSAPATGGK